MNKPLVKLRAGGQAHNDMLVHIRAGHLPGDLPVVHDQRTVAYTYDLLGLAAEHYNRNALSRQIQRMMS